jgi:hypothetical protein
MVKPQSVAIQERVQSMASHGSSSWQMTQAPKAVAENSMKSMLKGGKLKLRNKAATLRSCLVKTSTNSWKILSGT